MQAAPPPPPLTTHLNPSLAFLMGALKMLGRAWLDLPLGRMPSSATLVPGRWSSRKATMASNLQATTKMGVHPNGLLDWRGLLQRHTQKGYCCNCSRGMQCWLRAQWRQTQVLSVWILPKLLF